MSGEREFLLRSEDADPYALDLLDGRRPPLHKGGFTQVEFAGNRLHPLRRQTNGVGYHCDRVAGQRSIGEHVGDCVIQSNRSVGTRGHGAIIRQQLSVSAQNSVASSQTICVYRGFSSSTKLLSRASAWSHSTENDSS